MTSLTELSRLAQPAFAERTRLALTRNQFVALLVVVCACAGASRSVVGVVDVTEALVRGFIDNKVLWVCLGISAWHLTRNASPAVGGAHLAAAFPALFLVATAGGIWPWVGLSLSLCLLLLTDFAQGAARTGVLIALMAALHIIAIDILGELGGDAVLSAEASVAGFMAGLVWPDVEVHGTALQLSGGHMLVLVWGCSSLSNLGDAMLLFWALASVSVSGPIPHHLTRRFVGCAILMACVAIALNTLRLALMACGPDLYTYLHSGPGAALFRLIILGMTAAISLTAFSR